MMVRQFDLCNCIGRAHAGDVILEKGLLFHVQCNATANGNALHICKPMCEH
jgi:hypothetical protein